MKLVIEMDGRYQRTPDGTVWVKSGCLYDYWTRYLDVFEGVRLLSRADEVQSVSSDMHPVTGPGVEFAPLPYYVGPWQYMLQIRRVRKAARASVEWGDAVVLCGSPTSAAIFAKLHSVGYPYGVRVVGDPYKVLSPGSINHPLRPVLRILAPKLLRKICRHACGTIYVTQRTLQEGYPCPGYSVGVSDVDLPADSLAAQPRTFSQGKRRVTALMVGSLSQLYKAPDVLIDAVGICSRAGLDIELVIVGEGRYLPRLRAQAASLGLDGLVRFAGQLGREGVFAEMDRADLFLLPSRQEGLPRAMVEAMARGLPCIGSAVGGIPELLCEEDMVAPGNPHVLAGKICDVATDPGRMTRMSRRNLEKAAQYRDDVLRERWLDFYRFLRERTEEWLRANKR